MSKEIAIIGLGWLGMPLAMALQAQGQHVLGSKTTQDGVDAARLSGIECYRLQLTPDLDADDDDVTHLLAAQTLIINIPPGRHNCDELFYISAVQNLVDSALAQGQVQHIIFVSSTSVYGRGKGAVTEASGCYPETASARALHELENWLHALPGVRVDILRCAGLVGPGRHPARFLAGRQNLTDGAQGVNFVHLDDCIRAITLLLECRLPQGRIYNLCAPEHPIRSVFYPLISRSLGVEPPTFLPDTNGKMRVIDGSLICREQGFSYLYPDPAQMQF